MIFMIEDMKKRECGECGNGSFRLYSKTSPVNFMSALYVECMKCKSVTVLRPEQPRIEISWDECEGDGILC